MFCRGMPKTAQRFNNFCEGMEMINIEIKSPEVKTKSGIAAKSGKPYSIREQEGWAFTFDRNGKPNPYPVKLSLSLRDEQPPYQPGVYTICPSSLYTNRFDQLEISPVLIPFDQKALKAA